MFIDDGMETDKNNERMCNRFVKQLTEVMELAATLVFVLITKKYDAQNRLNLVNGYFFS